MTVVKGAKLGPTDAFALFQMAEERSMSVGSMLIGSTIPLTNAEFELYKTYKTACARLEQQRSKGI